MNLIVCLDDRQGMLFNARRQSSDSKLRARMLELVGEHKLWMNGYSARQFFELPLNVCVDEAFLQKAEQADYCFAENAEITEYVPKAEGIVIYRWNRTYPADVHFPVHLLCGFQLVSSTDFAGSSHERITEDMYEIQR